MTYSNFLGLFGNLLEAVSPEERFVLNEQEFHPFFGPFDAHVHIEDVLD